VGGVRVERLAAELGITKGSFYWHFRNRGELLEALLEHWAREMTEVEFERIQALREGLPGRLLALARDVLEKGMGRYDPAIRAWARTDRRVAAAVAQVDRRRVRALTGLFEQGGLSPADARTRARLFYTFLLGEPQVRSPAREAGELERMVKILAA
jgi:AcrR family transcriptional regulator